MAASDDGADIRGPPAAADLLNSLVRQAFGTGELTPRLQISTRRRTAPPTFVHAADRIQLLSFATDSNICSSSQSEKAHSQLPTTPPSTPRQMHGASEGGAAASTSLNSTGRPAASRPSVRDTVPRSNAWTGSWALAQASMHMDSRVQGHGMAAAETSSEAATPLQLAGLRPLLSSRLSPCQATGQSPASAASPPTPLNTPLSAPRPTEPSSAEQTCSVTRGEWSTGVASCTAGELSPRAVSTSYDTRLGTSASVDGASDAGTPQPGDGREASWQGLAAGCDPFIDDAIRRQVELLLLDKARLAEENRRLKSENQSLQDLLLIQEEMMLQDQGATDRDDSEEEDQGRDQEQDKERDGSGKLEKLERGLDDRREEGGGAVVPGCLTPLSGLTLQPCL